MADDEFDPSHSIVVEILSPMTEEEEEEEVLPMFLENITQDDGIVNFKFSKSKNFAVFKFTNPVGDIVELQKTIDSKKQLRFGVVVRPVPVVNEIIISGVSPKIISDCQQHEEDTDVQLYFESPTFCPDGGEVERVTVLPCHHEVIVRFKDPHVVRRLPKDHTISRSNVTVRPLDILEYVEKPNCSVCTSCTETASLSRTRCRSEETSAKRNSSECENTKGMSMNSVNDSDSDDGSLSNNDKTCKDVEMKDDALTNSSDEEGPSQLKDRSQSHTKLTTSSGEAAESSDKDHGSEHPKKRERKLIASSGKPDETSDSYRKHLKEKQEDSLETFQNITFSQSSKEKFDILVKTIASRRISGLKPDDYEMVQTCKKSRKVYCSGPDSERINKAIEDADGYGEVDLADYTDVAMKLGCSPGKKWIEELLDTMKLPAQVKVDSSSVRLVALNIDFADEAAKMVRQSLLPARVQFDNIKLGKIKNFLERRILIAEENSGFLELLGIPRDVIESVRYIEQQITPSRWP